MLIKVDWISFSVPVEVIEGADEIDAFYETAHAIRHLHPDLPELMALDAAWEAGNGRAPYRTSWKHPEGGITIFTHPAIPHALVEVSGRGCDQLQARQSLEATLSAVRSRCTRLDIACDMLTDVRPLDFAEQRDVKRWKAQSHVLSESGETYYVGARSSDRYARVYRYNAPHERAHLLRCEFCVKAQNAKLTIDAILATGLQGVAVALGDAFGWGHAAWAVEGATAAELAVYRPDRREGKTLYWLADTVAPLLARLHKEGVIDATKWLHENVIPRIIEDSDQ